MVSSIKILTAHEARERFCSLVMYDSLGQKFSEVSDKYLYHYTNLPGLKGIFGSSSIWASDFRYMNDKSEFRFGIDILEMIIAEPGDGPSLDRPLREKVLLETALIRKNKGLYIYVFVGSFCRKGNILSQWRAYAKDNGVAIGFNRSEIEKLCIVQDFKFDNVRYYFHKSNLLGSDTTSNDWLQGRINDLILKVDNSNENNRDRTIRGWIVETAAFIKHPSFNEEAEWRVIKAIDHYSDADGIELKDRVSGSNIIPYIDLKLNHISGINVFNHIVMGPANDPDATAHAISHVLRNQSLSTEYGIFQPYTPLRIN